MGSPQLPEHPIRRGLLDDADIVQISNDHPEVAGYCSSDEHADYEYTIAPCSTRRLLDHMLALKRHGLSITQPSSGYPRQLTESFQRAALNRIIPEGMVVYDAAGPEVPMEEAMTLMERPQNCSLCGREPRDEAERDEWHCYGCDSTICNQHTLDPNGKHEPQAHGGVRC